MPELPEVETTRRGIEPLVIHKVIDRVLVHNAVHETYVAERNLEPDESGQPIVHPLLEHFFSLFREGRYETGEPIN